MDNVTSDVSYKVKEWNHEIAQSLIPNNIILSLYMVAGVLGNSIVIFIYSFKMKGNKEERYFIPFLAMVDLWASLINASFAIAQNMMQASFDNDHLCKAWWFFSAFSTLTSALFLLIIAVHRYLKVCKPLGRQMTRTWKRFAMCMVLTFAFTLSVSLTNFYGSDPFLNEKLSIYGHRCSRLESANKTESLVFGGVLLLILLTNIISLVCLYSKIGLTIRKHFKHTKIIVHLRTAKSSEGGAFNSFTGRDTPSNDTENKTGDTGSTTVPQSTPSNDTENKTGDTGSTTVPQPTCTNTEVVTPTDNNGKNFRPKVSSTKTRNQKRVIYKFTLMFMLITVIFLICFIPKAIVMLMEARDLSFWEKFSNTERSVLLFVYRIYILNNIINPFIYAFLDRRFSKQIKMLHTCC